MFNKIAVIGLGSLGGFLCKHISELNFVTEMVLVDYDKVSIKDTYKTIYTSKNIDDYKTDALSNILNDNITITKLNTKYIEGITKIPSCNLVIDCRDVVCSRKDEIDLRMYLSGESLVVDGRKRVQTAEYKGKYSIDLSKNELNKAAFIATQLIESGEISNIIKNQVIQRIDLDLLSVIINKSVNKNIENKIDIVYDKSNGAREIHSINQYVSPILEINSKHDTEIFIGGRPKKIEKYDTKKYITIPKQEFKTSFDVIKNLQELVDRQPGITNFLITIKKHNGRSYVELLEETGAA